MSNTEELEISCKYDYDDDYYCCGTDEGEEEEEFGEGVIAESNKFPDKVVRLSPFCGGGGGGGKSSEECHSWNGAALMMLLCAAGLFVDPLFFYALSISETCMCLFVDAWFAAAVTVLRCIIDALHLCNLWLASIRRRKRRSNTAACGRPVTAPPYLKGSFLQLFLILPLPQIMLWVAIPAYLEKGSITTVMTLHLIVFLTQYLPKIYFFVGLIWRMHDLSGYTVWCGIALNMMAYFIASHAVGACWFLLGIQNVVKCLKEKCTMSKDCRPRFLTCKDPFYYRITRTISCNGQTSRNARLLWGENRHVRMTCLDTDDNNFAYGTYYEWTIQLVTNENPLEKILLPIFWGLMTLSSFGNLKNMTDELEVVFMILILTSGVLLVTMFIGSTKVFFRSMTSKKEAVHLKMRNIEWWMKKRRLPPTIIQRVRNYKWQRWAAMGGMDDEWEMLQDLPQGLRRDIKYHLCSNLIRQVPLFRHLDNLVMGNICDRLKSLVFTAGETISWEGEPVRRMLFIVRGHLECRQHSISSSCMLGPGNFSGDELLSWCLRRPFVVVLPPSSFTLVTLETTEALGLDAHELKYVTHHFRYTFAKERVKRIARYYSPGWRSWAVVAIQLAWRRYKRHFPM
ncbi:unnamed protein product [Cuscuta europaea]|uniref:Cyclic nucleotide-binding domain-containing protein n=1 Tax=Cuscuta europaea TaxID=41803 RepID=A0A9P0Z1H8_CUSEU|nr:unnamed protein product [Cuscuta europaea]